MKVKRLKNQNELEKIKQTLDHRHPCYILITCTEPDAQGAMSIEMHYKGDECLAALLVENASQVFEAQSNLEESQ